MPHFFNMNLPIQTSRRAGWLQSIELPQIIGAILALTTIGHVAVFAFRMVATVETLQVQYIPDDAYYYLVLARNFVRYRQWTFDSGVSLTSGFHPLHAYALTLIYSLFQPTTETFVSLGVIFTSLVSLMAALAAWLVGLWQKTPYYMLVLALMIGSRNFANNSISIMEWPLVVLFALLYTVFFFEAAERNRNRAARLFWIGLLGSLARSDFGLLPFSCFIAAVLLSYQRKNLPLIRASLTGLLGAAGGVLLVLLHSQLFTGSILQSSAQMKAHWAQVNGVEIDPNNLMVRLLALAGMILLAFLLFVAGRLHLRPHWFRALTQVRAAPGAATLLSSYLCIAGYALLYLRNSGGLQPWYTANLTVPLFVLLFGVVVFIDGATKETYRPPLRAGFSFIVIVLVIVNVLRMQRIDTTNARWPYQQFMLEAGNYLNEHPVNGRIGSWNAGIISYYQGGTVVNLDGLVNNDIYPYAVQNKLPEYLTQKDIVYLLDFDNMFNMQRRRRGGYDDPVFLNRLQVVRVFGTGQYIWKNLTLYRIAP